MRTSHPRGLVNAAVSLAAGAASERTIDAAECMRRCVGTRKNIRVHTSRLYCVSERRTVTSKKGRKNKAGGGVVSQIFESSFEKKTKKKNNTRLGWYVLLERVKTQRKTTSGASEKQGGSRRRSWTASSTDIDIYVYKYRLTI